MYEQEECEIFMDLLKNGKLIDHWQLLKNNGSVIKYTNILEISTFYR